MLLLISGAIWSARTEIGFWEMCGVLVSWYYYSSIYWSSDMCVQVLWAQSLPPCPHSIAQLCLAQNLLFSWDQTFHGLTFINSPLLTFCFEGFVFSYILVKTKKIFLLFLWPLWTCLIGSKSLNPDLTILFFKSIWKFINLLFLLAYLHKYSNAQSFYFQVVDFMSLN